MAGTEALVQEFYNNDDHRGLLLNNVQPTGNFILSGCGTFGKIEKVAKCDPFIASLIG